MASVVCAHASCCFPLLQGKIKSSREYVRCERRSDSGGALGARSAVVMRSCWLGEERRWKSGARRACRGGQRKRCAGVKRAVQVKAGLEELLHNQVLVSSASAGILGQCVKPFTSALFGRGFNWKLILTPGGMPSTHSATVTAATTALGLDRGLSDSLFGLAVILAGIVMYDAQGVRRSVGKQAEVINTMVFTHMTDCVPPQSVPSAKSSPNPSPYAIGVELARDPVQAELAFMEEADASPSQASKSPYPIGVELARDPVQAELAFMEEAEASVSQASKSTAVLSKEGSLKVNGTPSLPSRLAEEKSKLNAAVARAQILMEKGRLPSVKDGQVTPQEIGDFDGWRHIPLKESVGHTKTEVFVGAVWGIVITLVLHSSI